MMSNFVSHSQSTTIVEKNPVTGVVKQEITSGNTTKITIKKESRLNVQQLSRPEKVRKEEEVIEENELDFNN
jgi:hypothetical protein